MKRFQKSIKKLLFLFLVLLMLLQCSVVSFATVSQETTNQEIVNNEPTKQLEEIDKKEKQVLGEEKEENDSEEKITKIEDEATKAASNQNSLKENDKEKEGEATSTVEEKEESESDLKEDSKETVETSKKDGTYEEEAEETESSSEESLKDADENELADNESTEKDILNEINEELVSLDVEKENLNQANKTELNKDVIASQSEAESEDGIKVKKEKIEIPIATPNTLNFKAPANANYLTFTANEDNSSVTFNYTSGSNVEYNKNDAGWTNYYKGTQIDLSKGDTLKFKGKDVCTSPFDHFNMAGSISASGDVTSLNNEIGGEATLPDMCYMCMFKDCVALKTTPALPSTNLSQYCYNGMFEGCTNLTTAPTLPATTLAIDCYRGMFYGCTNLTVAPMLQATTLAKECYRGMFGFCTNLTIAPMLPATTLANGCYYGMFDSCTNLTVASELPATSLKTECYVCMFKDCENLKVYESQKSGTDLMLDTNNISGDLANANQMFSRISAGGTTDATPVANKKYYAKIKHTVTFDSTGGSTVVSQKVKNGECASRPADPTKSGYTFVDWYEDIALSNAFDFSTVITSDKTLYAKWNYSPTTHLVTFDSKGGSTVASQKVKDGECASKPANPTKSGYTFVNWYKEATYTNIYDFSTAVTSDITLYAKWQKVSQGGGGSSGGGSISGTVSSGQIVNGQVIATAVPTTQVVAITKTAATTQTINVQTQGAKWVKDPTKGFWMLAYINKKGQADIAKFGFVTLTMSNEKNKINTATYFFNQTGQMQTGWLTTSDGKKYFFDNAKTQDEGKMAVGWKPIQNDWYYFKQDGSMMKSTITPDGYLVDADGKWVNAIPLY